MSVVEQLRESPLFKGVMPADLDAVVNAMKRQAFPANHVLFEKGQAGDTMYIVLSGRVRIYTTDSQGNQITLSYQEPSRIFGDFAILDDNQVRSASAMIDEPGELLMLSRTDFLAFLPQHPTVGLAMIRNLADQVRHITTFLGKVNESIEHLEVGDYDGALREITSSGADSEIKEVVKAFIDMVHTVREREQARKTS